MKQFLVVSSILMSAALGACGGGGGGSSSSAVSVMPPAPPPPPPTSETIEVETQATEGNHTIVMPGDVISVTCTPDTAGTETTWSSIDSEISIASVSSQSTSVTINGTTSRRVDLVCSDNNSDASGSAPIFVNTAMESNFRINPVREGNMFAQQISTNDDPAPGCIEETPESLGADYVWVAYDARFSLGCYGAFSMVDDDGESFQVVSKLRWIFGVADEVAVLFLFGDMVLEKDRAYSFQTTYSFGPKPTQVGGRINTSGTDVITIEDIQTQKTVDGITYSDCIDYNFGNPDPNVESFYCDINNGTGTEEWALFLFADE